MRRTVYHGNTVRRALGLKGGHLVLRVQGLHDWHPHTHIVCEGGEQPEDGTFAELRVALRGKDVRCEHHQRHHARFGHNDHHQNVEVHPCKGHRAKQAAACHA